MNNRNNRATSHTRLTRAIVASGSLLAIIVIGLPWVDEYLRLRRDAVELQDLESKYVQIQSRQTQLSHVEKKLNSLLENLLVRSVDPANKETVRDTLIESVRLAGGKVRRLEIAPGEQRVWAVENDDPRKGTLPLYGEESRFVLHSHSVELQADGSLESVRRILSAVNSHGWLMTTKSLTMVPTSVRESPVSLELNLVFYGLGPNENDPEEDFARIDDQREIR
ncbi:MAG: hypothetical protein AB8B91_01255 [Rubripirellula sp.]